MLCLVLLTFTVASIVAWQASTPSWDALTTDHPSLRPPAILTPGERAELLAKAHQLRADVDWCQRRALAAHRKASMQTSRSRSRLLKEADVFDRMAGELAGDALALLTAAEA